MPYKHKKVGNKYCVYNKETGKKRGCTKGNKTALKKYYRALYANADEGLKSQLKKHVKRLIKEVIDEEILQEITSPILKTIKITNKTFEQVLAENVGIQFDEKEIEAIRFAQGVVGGIQGDVLPNKENAIQVKYSSSDMFGNNNVNVIKKLKNMQDPSVNNYISIFMVVPAEEQEPTKPTNNPQAGNQQGNPNSIIKIFLSQPFDDSNSKKLEILGDFIKQLPLKA